MAEPRSIIDVPDIAPALLFADASLRAKKEHIRSTSIRDECVRHNLHATWPRRFTYVTIC